MTRLTTKSGSETRHRRALERTAIAGMIALACGCTGRLAVSEEGIDADAGGTSGSGGSSSTSGASGSGGTIGDASTSCQDGTLSGGESDIDCGGLDCPPCAPQSRCTVHADCQSGSCRGGLCRAPACDDGVKNGDETSVDCGGPSCTRCASQTCNCASSPELTALECDETDGPIFPGGTPMITPDGESAVFMICHSSVVVPGTPVCSTFRWTVAGSERIADQGAYGASRDGQKVLLQNDDGTGSLLQIGGGTTPVPLYFPMLLSADGTQAVNIQVLESGATALQRWSEAGGVEVLAELTFPNLLGSSEVRAVSSDASSIVGFVETEGGDIPFRWTDGSGLETLGPIPEGASGARPGALNEDGSVVVGVTTTFGAQSVMVFRWTPSGLETLAPAQPGVQSGGYMATTADGAVIAATIGYPDPLSSSAWRFSTADGVSILNMGSSGVLHGMTPDGAIFIGTEGQDSVKWVAQPAVANELRQFTTVRFASALEASGVDLTGWELGPPTSVSDDGRMIFGRATCGGVPTLYRWVSSP